MHKRMVKWLSNGMIEVTDGCWNWLGCLNTDGYPKVAWEGDCNGKGHRIVFSMYNPDKDIHGLCVRHTCDNTRCINPEHLKIGNSIDNVKDRHDRRRTYNQVSSHEIEQVLYLRRLGSTYKQIADLLGCSYKRIEYISTRYGG